MSSVSRWAGTGLGGDAYVVVDESGREIVNNGHIQYIHRDSREFTEHEAALSRARHSHQPGSAESGPQRREARSADDARRDRRRSR